MVALIYVIQQYTLYVGYFLFITGIFGNIMNIFILSAVNSYRATPSTFYFLIASIYNILILLVGLISRILETGYELDLSNSSVIWCKIRQYFITSISIIPFYCQCFATIHQFLITSKNQRLRKFSTIKRTYWISICLTIICLLHGIPFLIYYDISSKTNLCTSMNAALSLANQHADRQVTLMICMQIILIIWSTIPYGIFTIFLLLTNKTIKDQDRLYKELLIFTIVSLNTYVHTGGSFYIFIISSSRFRQIVKKWICCWRISNQIEPQ